MCDTLGIIENKGNRALFAKNSDRSPNEPQILEYIPAKYNNNKREYIKQIKYYAIR